MENQVCHKSVAGLFARVSYTVNHCRFVTAKGRDNRYTATI